MKTIILILAALMLSGCSTLDNNSAAKLGIQYGVIKFVASSEIALADILAHTTRLRALVTEDYVVDVARLAEEVTTQINWTRLDEADRFLLFALIQAVTEHLQGLEIGDRDRAIQFLTVLDWIDSAARMGT